MMHKRTFSYFYVNQYTLLVVGTALSLLLLYHFEELTVFLRVQLVYREFRAGL
jgi:hypothetical protein